MYEGVVSTMAALCKISCQDMSFPKSRQVMKSHFEKIKETSQELLSCKTVYEWEDKWLYSLMCPQHGIKHMQGRKCTIFQRGKVIFPDFYFPGVKCFFSVENSHFGRPKTDFSGFEK